jgi:hypothetical protein
LAAWLARLILPQSKYLQYLVFGFQLRRSTQNPSVEHQTKSPERLFGLFAFGRLALQQRMGAMACFDTFGNLFNLPGQLLQVFGKRNMGGGAFRPSAWCAWRYAGCAPQ